MVKTAVPFTVEDLRTPEKLERVLRLFDTAVVASSAPPPPLNLRALAESLAPLLRDQLQSAGKFPLNLQSLLPAVTGATVLEGTHSQRLVLSTPPGAVGQVFWETDRSTGYVSFNNGGPLVWRWFSGCMGGATLADRPADLGPDDIGFLFMDLSNITQWEWTGTAWFTSGGLYQSITDSVANAPTAVFKTQHLTSGVPAVGMAVDRQAHLGTPSAAVPVFRERVVFTSGTTDAALELSLLQANVLTFLMRLASSGDLGITGSLFIQAATAFFGQFTHGNTANRIYTLPDATGNITYETVPLTLDNILTGGGGALVKDSGSNLGAWTAWVPVFSTNLGNAAFSFTAPPTVQLARYKVLGKTAMVEVAFFGNLTAITPNAIILTLPAPVVPPFDVFNAAWVFSGAATLAGFIQCTSGSHVLVFYNSGTANWPVSSPIECRGTLTFEIL